MLPKKFEGFLGQGFGAASTAANEYDPNGFLWRYTYELGFVLPRDKYNMGWK